MLCVPVSVKWLIQKIDSRKVRLGLYLIMFSEVFETGLCEEFWKEMTTKKALSAVGRYL